MSITIEFESGTVTRASRRHNGYFAGTFTSEPQAPRYLQAWFAWGRAQGNGPAAPLLAVANSSSR